MWSANYASFFANGASYTRSINDLIQYEFFFTSTNPLTANGAIVITYPIAPQAGSICIISNGLEDISRGKKM